MSILRFLLLMLLSIITLVSFTAALSGYQASLKDAEQLFDQNLADFASSLQAISQHAIADRPVFMQGMAFQVWRNQRLVARSTNAPLEAIAAGEPGFGETNFNGQRWRIYSGTEGDRRIVVAQPLSDRIELAESLALTSLSPLVVAMPLLALLIALTISRGLSPLKKLSALLRGRQANDFSAVELAESPAELQPVVHTINRLFERVAAAFEREKRFSADAAHELRTPISVLQVSIHNLAERHPELHDELNQLHAGVQRMSHVVEQILLLNRTHPDYIKASFNTLSLTELCQQSIVHCYEQIDSKRQTIELDHRPAAVMGDTFALSTLLNNLILNASKYTPDEGEIRVSIAEHHGSATVVIEDSGPGIDEKDYQRVLDRFYRSGGDQHVSQASGCGLGMAIVKQVVDLHGGHIELGRSEQLGGLKVSVSLPAVAEGGEP